MLLKMFTRAVLLSLTVCFCRINNCKRFVSGSFMSNHFPPTDAWYIYPIVFRCKAIYCISLIQIIIYKIIQNYASFKRWTEVWEKYFCYNAFTEQWGNNWPNLQRISGTWELGWFLAVLQAWPKQAGFCLLSHMVTNSFNVSLNSLAFSGFVWSENRIFIAEYWYAFSLYQVFLTSLWHITLVKRSKMTASSATNRWFTMN